MCHGWKSAAQASTRKSLCGCELFTYIFCYFYQLMLMMLAKQKRSSENKQVLSFYCINERSSFSKASTHVSISFAVINTHVKVFVTI